MPPLRKKRKKKPSYEEGDFRDPSIKDKQVPSYLDAYLDEFSWRFNNRHNPFLFRDTLLALIAEDALPYKELIEA